MDSIAILMEFFSSIGAKPLLMDYESSVGHIDAVVKHKGKLLFIGINRTNLEKVARYYMKHYGIKNMKYELVNF